jgi:hypothetical protein
MAAGGAKGHGPAILLGSRILQSHKRARSASVTHLDCWMVHRRRGAHACDRGVSNQRARLVEMSAGTATMTMDDAEPQHTGLPPHLAPNLYHEPATGIRASRTGIGPPPWRWSYPDSPVRNSASMGSTKR